MSRLIIALAAAAVLLSDVAVDEGWAHTIAAVLLVVSAAWFLTIARRTASVRACNGRPPGITVAHLVADLIIAIAAADKGSPAARDLALEAQSMLDDWAADGASGISLLLSASLFAVRMRRQEQLRAQQPASSLRTPVAPSAFLPRSRAMTPGFRVVLTTAVLLSMMNLTSAQYFPNDLTHQRGAGELALRDLAIPLFTAGVVAAIHVVRRLRSRSSPPNRPDGGASASG